MKQLKVEKEIDEKQEQEKVNTKNVTLNLIGIKQDSQKKNEKTGSE